MKKHTPWPLPPADHLGIPYLSHLFDNMSECYKLFWFQAIVDLAGQDHWALSYDELINEMIAGAWYMVAEYKLNLGPADTLESLVHEIHRSSGLKSSEKKEKILDYLSSCEDTNILKKKRTLTLHVPYRLQAPFMEHVKGREWNVPERSLAKKINEEKRLMYYFAEIAGMKSQIVISPPWHGYIIENREILRGWIQYYTVSYLQRRNPDVPGIINKLYPPQERKLEKVKKYWKQIITLMPVRDIYAEELLNTRELSIDHFVPWSYVAHDELWNLSPTTRSANSSKSNSLPTWSRYFPRLCEIEYQSYQAIWKYEKIREEFERCRKEHVNSEEIRRQLYCPGLDKREFCGHLENILLPVYQSAENMGFREWSYGR